MPARTGIARRVKASCRWHDTGRCHTAIMEGEAVPIIPIRGNGRPWEEDGPAARASPHAAPTARPPKSTSAPPS